MPNCFKRVQPIKAGVHGIAVLLRSHQNVSQLHLWSVLRAPITLLLHLQTMNPTVGLLGLVVFCQNIRLTTSNFGIPGTTQTTSGKVVLLDKTFRVLLLTVKRRFSSFVSGSASPIASVQVM